VLLDDLEGWCALELIRLELMLVQVEQPELTPNQQLREARRRASRAMLAAVDALERKAHRRAALSRTGRSDAMLPTPHHP
jgi:hypothetical protein